MSNKSLCPTNLIYFLYTLQVFIPINEPKKHWSVAQFHIQSGNVIFYDSLYRCEEEGRDWYLKMRNCLSINLPRILLETGVFDKKQIDPENYKISFRLAQNVPKQGGVFGDCGVFVCMFLYRLVVIQEMYVSI